MLIHEWYTCKVLASLTAIKIDKCVVRVMRAQIVVQLKTKENVIQLKVTDLLFNLYFTTKSFVENDYKIKKPTKM